MTKEEFEIKKRELETLSLEKEIQIRKIEIEKLEKQALNRKKILTPISATIIVAVLGLIGTFITNYLQKESAIAIEKKKFEFEIYAQAQQAEKPEQAAQILDFYIRAGLIPGVEGEFSKYIEEGEFDKVPVLSEKERTIKEVYGDIEIPTQSSKELALIDHFVIGENINHLLSVNTSGKFDSGFPDAIVLHYTASESLKGAVDAYANNSSIRASAHFVVGKDGKITQLIPLNYISWGAGKSQYDGRVGWNNYSIQIEMVNAGVLTKSNGIFKSWWGKEYSNTDVLKAKHKNSSNEQYWEKYPQKQIDRVFELCEFLAKQYDIKYVLGHEDLSPDRKFDPGPAFPMKSLQKKILEE